MPTRQTTLPNNARCEEVLEEGKPRFARLHKHKFNMVSMTLIEEHFDCAVDPWGYNEKIFECPCGRIVRQEVYFLL